MWFLITPNDLIPQALLWIDRSSGKSRAFPLAGHRRYFSQWLHMDGKGNAWLLRQEKKHDALAVFAPDGQLKSEIAIEERAAGYAILTDGFLSVTWAGVLRMHGPDGRIARTLTVHSKDGLRLDPMPDGSVVTAYDPLRGSAWTVDVKRWSVQPMNLTAPEIEERVASRRPQDVVIPHLAVDAESNLWTTLSKIRLREGGLVVKLGPDGRHLATYRCVLPETDRTLDPDNLMTPTLIGLGRSTLYLVSHRGTVAVHRIPD